MQCYMLIFTTMEIVVFFYDSMSYGVYKTFITDTCTFMLRDFVKFILGFGICLTNNWRGRGKYCSVTWLCNFCCCLVCPQFFFFFLESMDLHVSWKHVFNICCFSNSFIYHSYWLSVGICFNMPLYFLVTKISTNFLVILDT